MRTNKGFTLIEIAVVLAIIAILAAILTPIVTSYIDQARTTRAASDVKKIAEAVLLFKRDTGVYPPYNTFTAARTGTVPDLACLLSQGAPSTNLGALAGTMTCATAGSLSQYLNVNSMGITSANGPGGVISYRGPYLDGVNGADPWGNTYIVNSAFLTENSTTYSFAASAGPNGVFEITQAQLKTGNFSVGGDDIASLIR